MSHMLEDGHRRRPSQITLSRVTCKLRLPSLEDDSVGSDKYVLLSLRLVCASQACCSYLISRRWPAIDDEDVVVKTQMTRRLLENRSTLRKT